jgi:hypothetical protein
MNKLIFAAVTATALTLAAPASAQLGVGAGPGGVGVQVGPFGGGIGPGYGWGPRHRWDRSMMYMGMIAPTDRQTVGWCANTSECPAVAEHRICG